MVAWGICIVFVIQGFVVAWDMRILSVIQVSRGGLGHVHCVGDSDISWWLGMWIVSAIQVFRGGLGHMHCVRDSGVSWWLGACELCLRFWYFVMAWDMCIVSTIQEFRSGLGHVNCVRDSNVS